MNFDLHSDKMPNNAILDPILVILIEVQHFLKMNLTVIFSG